MYEKITGLKFSACGKWEEKLQHCLRLSETHLRIKKEYNLQFLNEIKIIIMIEKLAYNPLKVKHNDYL